MFFLIRPSKIFLFSKLKHLLHELRGNIGLDAGCANLKNRRMFQTKLYYGLDRNLDLLRAGLAKYNDGQTFGIYADMAKLDVLPDNSVDVLVTTNTLNHLNPDDRKLAIKHLCRLAKSHGHFLCEMSLDQDFDALAKMIKSYFENSDVIYYRNALSRFYEGIFERDGDLSTHPIAGRRPFRLLAWLISRLEYLTCFWRVGNRHALIVCSGKIVKSSDEAFVLSGLPFIEPRIYKAMENPS